MTLTPTQPILAALMAFGLTMLAGPFAIRYLQRLKLGQIIRQEGPESHLKKGGTPSMGGTIILLAAAMSTAWFGRSTGHLPIALLAALGFGTVGLADDLIKVAAKRSLGLQARYKLLIQAAIALIVAVYALSEPTIGTTLLLPFSSTLVQLPPALYILLVLLTLMATTNAVNLTDGVDGLAAGATAISASTYLIIAIRLGCPDMALFSGAVAGACLGFCWFNAHPAQVFMGDTGSLGLGAALAVIALFTQTPLLLPFIGGLFVIETLSVIFQVSYYRMTGGKRLLRMSPLHHHFELKGWQEPQVMLRFWLIAIVSAAVGLLALS